MRNTRRMSWARRYVGWVSHPRMHSSSREFSASLSLSVLSRSHSIPSHPPFSSALPLRIRPVPFRQADFFGAPLFCFLVRSFLARPIASFSLFYSSESSMRMRTDAHSACRNLLRSDRTSPIRARTSVRMTDQPRTTIALSTICVRRPRAPRARASDNLGMRAPIWIFGADRDAEHRRQA